MKEIGSISLVNMNNAAHFLFVSNMAVTAEDENLCERNGVTEDICIDIEPSRGLWNC